MAKNKSTEIRLNRASRKGREAGQRANMKPLEEFKRLRSFNPYTEGGRAAAWLAAFDANGNPKQEEDAA